LVAPSAVWGRMRIWCRNESFGDFENPYNALYSASERFRVMRDAHPNLWDPTFEGLEDTEIFRIFNEAIYNGTHSNSDEIVDLADRFWKFDFLTNWGEHFDPLKGLLAFDPNGEALFMIEDGDDRVRGFRFPQASFVEAASDFVRWFDSEAERLQNMAGEQVAAPNT
ncbi:MAG: hypothetical protein R3F19_35275, partial [Verrucomicrobiales bacterium]